MAVIVVVAIPSQVIWSVIKQSATVYTCIYCIPGTPVASHVNNYEPHSPALVQVVVQYFQQQQQHHSLL